MIMTNKLLPVALIAALIGGSIGALVMHRSQPATAETTTSTGAQVAGAQEKAGQQGSSRQRRFHRIALPSDLDYSGREI